MEKEQPLVYLSFSSELSGTYQTAKMVEQEIKEEHPEAPIHVIDLKCASLGYGLAVLDRKSTRLNSSHVAISYAVFCLKKKTPRAHNYGSPPRQASAQSCRPPATRTAPRG